MVPFEQVAPKKPKVKNLKKIAKVEKVKKKKSLKENVIKQLSSIIQEKQSKIVPQKAVLTLIKKKKVKYVMPSKCITENLVTSSLTALQQLAAHYKKKNTIFEDETPIFAEINCVKIQNSKGNIKL